MVYDAGQARKGNESAQSEISESSSFDFLGRHKVTYFFRYGKVTLGAVGNANANVNGGPDIARCFQNIYSGNGVDDERRDKS